MAHAHAPCSLDFENASIPVFESGVAEPYTRPETGYVPGAAGSDAYRERELRAFCCRLFGWGDEVADVVDDRMHTILTAARQGTPIALRGESDLVPVAHALHRRLFGPDAPFVVCDPQRRHSDGAGRWQPNRITGRLALDAAIGGSVCVRAKSLPPDFLALATSFREAGSLAMLFVCLHDRDPIRDVLCPPVDIPSLAERASDHERLLDEYLRDAAKTLGVRRVRLAPHLRESILRDVESLADLENTTLRVVAIASARSVAQAATRLHMASVSLSRWVGRRRWITSFLCEEREYADETDVQ